MFVCEPRSTTAAARRAAGWLAARGLVSGDRVAIVAHNDPRYLELTMGALGTGVVPVLINPYLSPTELHRLLTDAEPALVIEGWPDTSAAAPRELAPFPMARPMHYTSGTTGLSKGVWSGVFSEDDAEAHALDERELWEPRPGDTILVCSPLYHSAPHRIALSALLAGARVCVFERFDASAVAVAFVAERVTGAFLVPTHLRRLLAQPFQAPSARRILHAGEPCPEELKRRALATFPPHTLWEFYGSTEGQFAVCAPGEWLERPGTVGGARPGRELRVLDPGADGVGTVYVTAPSFARWSYWRDEDKTAAAWDGDAFTVGDLGRLDGDGYLYLSGRREDLIVSGGVNVYPAEVERVLLAHPGVVEAAVFGIDDPEWGMRVCAAVVADGVDPGELRGWTRRRLPGSHAPKQVFLLDALPRTLTGKVRRSELSERWG